MWKLVIIVLFEFCDEIKTKQVTGRYECGEHGKFEYCLEGVPGCVIGCHCHPGYYFDTDTKVCEPNNRLAQNYRKYNSDDGPTRKQFDLNAYPTRVNNDEFTTVANINDKLNDDLGDWLYNQFFKTVENQVLNETSRDPDTPSRRSNDIDPKKTPSRRSRKRKDKKKSKKRKTRKDRRRKLLKIPSDDPMWETSGESNSDSSSSSNSNSGSSSESGSESKEKKKSKKDQVEKSAKKKSDHDHSKFLIIKKQPKSPLPSFIFLPNVETPYYPSVGIAAAAAMPMYPMVPVPPMVSFPGPPLGAPVPGLAPGPDGIGGIPAVPETSTTNTNNDPAESTSTTVQDNEDKKDDGENEEKTQKEDDENNLINRAGIRMRKLRKKGRLDGTGRLQQAQQAPQLSRRHHKILKAPLPLPIQTNFPVPTLNEGRNEPTIQVIQASSKPQHNMQDDPDKLENIKYLSQLIRKTQGSQTEKSVPKHRGGGDFNNMILQRIENQLKSFQDPPEEKLKRNNQILKKISNHLTHILTPKNEEKEELKPSRRMLYREEPNVVDEGDAYYANLGRQIASVIKDVYPNSIPDSTPLSPPVFNENSYSSRSFWERAVRSPTSHTILSELTTKQSLYDLENKVKNAATDVPFLSLSEIENIINMVNGENNKKHDVQVHVSHTEHNTTRILNLDLFPKNSLMDIKQNSNKETNLQQYLPTVPRPLTKYSIFKTVHLDDKNIVTTPKDNHDESKDQTTKGYQNPNTLHNKHHTRHHTHHHDHHHLMPYDPSHHKHLSKEDEKEPNHDDDGINQHKTHKDYENIINKELDEKYKKKTLDSENNYTISKNEKPTGYNIDDDVVDNLNNNFNIKRSNESKNDNSNNKTNQSNNLQNRKLYGNDDAYIDVNPSANINLNPNKIGKDNLYVYPNVNHLTSLNENVYVYTNENPDKTPVSNRNPNRNHKIEPIYSSLNPLLTYNINGVPHAQLAAQNMYRPRTYNINGIPNEGPKLQSMFPNLNLEASNPKNQKYSNNHEISLNTEIDPIVNIELPANFEVNTSSSSTYGDRQYSKHLDVMPKVNNHNTRRTIVTNDTEKYSNYLPRPYSNLSYNIAHRRQAHAYPYPTIFKGARPSNQNKPIWTGLNGRGLRAFKKPHTPIFRSALFFDDFN